MTIYVADHAWGWVPAGDLKAAGYSGDIGYCSYDHTGKNWTVAKIEERLAAGLRCGLNWETQGMRSLSGAPGAQADAPEFLRQAHALGATGGTLLVNLEDPSPVDPANYPVMTDYGRTMRQLIKAAGFDSMTGYGSDRFLTYCKANGGCDRKWAVETWPRGTWNPDLIQLANSHPLNTWNGNVDCNIASSADWGYTLFHGAKPGGPEVLDPTDPIVIELRARGANIEADANAILVNALGGKDATAPDGSKVDTHWAVVWVLELVKEIKAEVDTLKAGGGGAVTTGLADADVQRVAAAVLDHLRAKPLAPGV